jgi:serine/threonine protein kinase
MMTRIKQHETEERAATSSGREPHAAPTHDNTPRAPLKRTGRDAQAVSPGSERQRRDITLVVAGAQAQPKAPDSDALAERGSSGIRHRLPIVERENYEIVGEIARGGIGRIHRAREKHLCRFVALKELLHGTNPDTEARFVREALLTARLQHPSIIPVYEAGCWPSGEPFYTMKLVPGRSLADALEGRAYEQRIALLPHVLAVAEAIAYAHSQHILHRDLKPSNILVGDLGETMVIDWGLAKDLEARQANSLTESALVRRLELGLRSPDDDDYNDDSLTVAGSVIGTPAYMPPEQACGAAVDERADVYAIGAILYHVLAGKPPYEGSNPAQVVRRVAVEPPVPLSQMHQGIPAILSTIVEVSMARSPLARYATADDLADELRRFLSGPTAAVHRRSGRDRWKRVLRRYRLRLLVTLAGLLILAAFGALAERLLVAG